MPNRYITYMKFKAWRLQNRQATPGDAYNRFPDNEKPQILGWFARFDAEMSRSAS